MAVFLESDAHTPVTETQREGNSSAQRIHKPVHALTRNGIGLFLRENSYARRQLGKGVGDRLICRKISGCHQLATRLPPLLKVIRFGRVLL